MLRHVAACLLIVCSAVPADTYQEAVAAFQAGRFSDALSILGQLGMDNSNTPAVQNLKALAAVELSRYPEALNSIRRARELAPDNPSYAYNHGLILFEARDFSAAKQVFLNALTRFGLNVRLLSGLGETLLRLNEFDEAEKRLRQAAELEPSNAAPRVVAARLYYAIGDRENFRAAAERAFLLDPENGKLVTTTACFSSSRPVSPPRALVTSRKASSATRGSPKVGERGPGSLPGRSAGEKQRAVTNGRWR